MAGSLVILHRKDESNDINKLETNNLSLHSIVDNTAIKTAELVSDFSKQKAIQAGLLTDLDRIRSILDTYQYIANYLYNLMYTISMEQQNTDKLVEIETQAAGEVNK